MIRFPRRAILCACWASVLTLPAQTAIDLRSQAKNVDFSNATATKPNRSGTALAGTCGVGETFFLTTAAAGKNLYGCSSTNNWVALGTTSLPASSTPGQVLTWNGTSWQAMTPGGLAVVLSFPTIVDGTCGEQTAALPYQWQPGSAMTVTMPAQFCDVTGGSCYTLAGMQACARITAVGSAAVRVCNLSGGPLTLPSAQYGLTAYGSSSISANVSFPMIADGACATKTVAVTGVTASSAIALGQPAALEAGLIVTAAPAGAGNVAITACNWSGSAVTPAAASYQLIVN